MKKYNRGLMFFLMAVFAHTAYSQSMEEGKKFMYYEKYLSARSVFEKILAATPGNGDAAYWLGQTMLDNTDNMDLAGAKSLYQKSLMLGPNSPLLIVGMGQVELLEGKNSDARQRFETALSLSGGKNIPVYNAIGWASYKVKSGDALYAIDKLKQAIQIKGFKDPETWCLLGDNYRKVADGGNAQSAYESALALNNNYARASFRIGEIYQTQGLAQEDLFMRYYNEAISKDPGYCPVFYKLYDYYYLFNVVKSGEYLDKWLSCKDDEPINCYYRTTMKYAQGAFRETITQAEKCIASSGASPDPRLFGLQAYAFLRMNDTVNARKEFQLYFQKQNPDKLGPTDFQTYGEVLISIPGEEALAGAMFDKAAEKDSTEEGKVAILKKMISILDSRKMYNEAANWYKKIVLLKRTPSRTDIFNAGYNYYRSGSPQPALEMFNLFSQKYPEDILAYYWVGKVNWTIDTSMTLGSANPSFEKVILLGEAAPDKSKVKVNLMTAFKYMIAYTFNIKKDKVGALAFCNRALAVDSTDAEVLANKDAISRAVIKPANPTPAPKPGTKPVKTVKPVAQKPVVQKKKS